MGKYDKDVVKLFNKGFGGRLIAKELGINHGTVSKRMKRLGLNTQKKNQYNSNPENLSLTFVTNKEKLRFAAEHFARYLFVACGYEILNPDPYEGKPYDFLANGLKIQIKTSYSTLRSGNYIFSITKSKINRSRTCHEPYKDGEIDYFFLYNDIGDSWLIPHGRVKGKTSIVPASSFLNCQVTKNNVLINL